jgi:hypothetical protein
MISENPCWIDVKEEKWKASTPYKFVTKSYFTAFGINGAFIEIRKINDTSARMLALGWTSITTDLQCKNTEAQDSSTATCAYAGVRGGNVKCKISATNNLSANTSNATWDFWNIAAVAIVNESVTDSDHDGIDDTVSWTGDAGGFASSELSVTIGGKGVSVTMNATYGAGGMMGEKSGGASCHCRDDFRAESF